MLASNAPHFTPETERAAEPYVALRLWSTVLAVLAALVMVVGGLLAIFVVLSSLGSAGAVSRFAPGAVTAGVAGAGLLGGLLIFLVTALEALVLWATAQAIRALLSIEGHVRESATLQRGMLMELRRIAASTSTASPIAR